MLQNIAQTQYTYAYLWCSSCSSFNCMSSVKTPLKQSYAAIFKSEDRCANNQTRNLLQNES